MLGPAGAKVDVRDPLGVLQWFLGPESGALVARGRRSEDDLVGEDLRPVGVALKGEIGYCTVAAGAYSGRGNYSVWCPVEGRTECSILLTCRHSQN